MKAFAFFDIPHTFYQYISISDFPQHLATITDVDSLRTWHKCKQCYGNAQRRFCCQWPQNGILKLEINHGWINVFFKLDFPDAPFLLPPANEVWGKVIFSVVFVILSMGVSVWCHFLSSCLVPCSFWGSSLLLVPCYLQGVSVRGVSFCQGDPPTENPHTVKSGRYVSYWNAFLLFCLLLSPPFLALETSCWWYTGQSIMDGAIGISRGRHWLMRWFGKWDPCNWSFRTLR